MLVKTVNLVGPNSAVARPNVIVPRNSIQTDIDSATTRTVTPAMRVLATRMRPSPSRSPRMPPGMCPMAYAAHNNVSKSPVVPNPIPKSARKNGASAG